MSEQPRTPVTIYDVAKAAGVAPSTVSRTFGRPGRVSADTAARIREVAEHLGYRANPVARSAATSPTRLLGLMVSDVSDPFYSQLIRGAQVAATQSGFEILLADSCGSAGRERATLERLIPVVEGLVIGSSQLSDSALSSIAAQRPMVVVNRALPDVSSVVTDNVGGAGAVVELLRDLGHDAATYVAGPDASWTAGVRFRALRDLGERAGLAISRIGPFPPTFDGGLAAARTLLAAPPTAVIGYNDLIAVGVMHGLLAEGVAVPAQVSVIGFDDILISRIALPTLTTVAAPLRQLGTTAVKNVVALINGAKHRGNEPLVVPVQLRVRGSTAQRRRKSVSPALGTTMVSGSAS